MKKENLPNTQQGTGSAENKNENRDQQKNPATSISENQRSDIAHQADLGRHRMTDIAKMGDLSGRDDYAGGDSDDLSNENLNSTNDQ